MSNNNFYSKVLWQVNGVFYGTRKQARELTGQEPTREIVPHSSPEALAKYLNALRGVYRPISRQEGSSHES